MSAASGPLVRRPYLFDTGDRTDVLRIDVGDGAAALTWRPDVEGLVIAIPFSALDLRALGTLLIEISTGLGSEPVL